MPDIKDPRPALLLVDVQKGMDNLDYWGGERNNPHAEKNIESLLQLWRQKKFPVFHIKHCSVVSDSPLRKGVTGNDFKDFIVPKSNEPIIEKEVNSAFIGTSLKEQLEKLRINTLVIAGLTTDHCVSTTTRMAGNYGFQTFLVEDATATFSKKGPRGENYPAQLIHDTAIASLHKEFATVVSTREIAFTINNLLQKN
ncbi:cysteine hydrolase family protein [Ascidiimonas aurantiaca]|uniref:cysteine hydrolase family protein n=1 Tax=Ascidiimonas aurantiaca TaxID=1685432 RepID=UPI0030EB27C0